MGKEHGTVKTRHGEARRGKAQGKARQGMARHGEAKEDYSSKARVNARSLLSIYFALLSSAANFEPHGDFGALRHL